MNDGDLIAEWCSALRGRNYARLTVGQYRRTVTSFERWSLQCGLTFATVSHVDVVRWLDSLSHAPCTRYAYISTLSSFYGWAIREEHLTFDPTVRVDRPRLGRRLPRPAATDDIAEALDGADTRTVAMVACGVFAGMRVSEIASLHTDSLLLTLEPPMVLLRGKGGRERLVPIHDALLAALRAHGLPDSGWVFPSPTTGHGLSSGHVGKLIGDGLLGRATPHQLRHWFATKTYEESGGDIRIVQELLGHASPATTAIYTAFSRPKAARVVRGLRASRAELPDDQEAA